MKQALEACEHNYTGWQQNMQALFRNWNKRD